MEYNFNSEEAKELIEKLPLPHFNKTGPGYYIEIVHKPDECDTMITPDHKCKSIVRDGTFKLINKDNYGINLIEFRSSGRDEKEVIEDLKRLLTTDI